MVSPADLQREYRDKSDGEILQLAREGGFSPEAQSVFAAELARRKLAPEVLQAFDKEQADYEASKNWTDPNRNGFFQVFGKFYLSEEDRSRDIRVRTRWFCIRGVPLVPVASYRYEYRTRKIGSVQYEQVKLLDRVPMNWRQALLTYAQTLGWVLAILATVIAWDYFRNHLHS